MQVLAHDDRQGATSVGQAEEGGAQGAQGIGPSGGQQEHHRVPLDSGEVLGAHCRQRVGLDGQQIQVGVELTLLSGLFEVRRRPQRVVPLEKPPVLLPRCSVLDGRQPPRKGEVAGAVADENEIAGGIVRRPFVEVGLVAVAEPEQAGGGQGSPGQVVANDGHLGPPDGPHGGRAAAGVSVSVVSVRGGGGRGQRVVSVASLLGEFHQQAGHGNLGLRRFGEGDADGVAQALGQQRPDADGTLDAPVFAFAGLGHAEVERVGHALLAHAVGEHAVGLHHDLRVAGLHGQHDVVVVLIPADVQEFHGALDHAERGVAVVAEDAVRQRPVVGADAHGPSERLAFAHERGEPVADAGQFVGVGRFCVIVRFELLLVGVIARVDPNLLDVVRGDFGGVGREMDVGDEGHIGVSGLIEAGPDVPEGLGLPFAGRRDADDLATGLDHAHRFSHGGVHVQGVRRGHRLEHDGGVSPDGDSPDPDGPGGHPADVSGGRVLGHGMNVGRFRVGSGRNGGPLRSTVEGNIPGVALFVGSRLL